jgi:hypothetical protein
MVALKVSGIILLSSNREGCNFELLKYLRISLKSEEYQGNSCRDGQWQLI